MSPVSWEEERQGLMTVPADCREESASVVQLGMELQNCVVTGSLWSLLRGWQALHHPLDTDQAENSQDSGGPAFRG
jgi:hypothetical protein